MYFTTGEGFKTVTSKKSILQNERLSNLDQLSFDNQSSELQFASDMPTTEPGRPQLRFSLDRMNLLKRNQPQTKTIIAPTILANILNRRTNNESKEFQPKVRRPRIGFRNYQKQGKHFTSHSQLLYCRLVDFRGFRITN